MFIANFYQIQIKAQKKYFKPVLINFKKRIRKLQVKKRTVCRIIIYTASIFLISKNWGYIRL